MPHDPGKYLRDMLDHAVRIETYISGKSRDDFLNSDSLQDAVHWNLCVIGEALSQLRGVEPATAQKLTGHTLPVLVQELRSLLGR